MTVNSGFPGGWGMPSTYAAAMYSEVSRNAVVGARVARYTRETTIPVPAAQRYGGGSRGAVGVAVMSLVSELALAGDDHGDLVLVGRRDHLGVPHRAARLDDGGDAGGRGLFHPVGKGEEGVGGEHAALGVVALLPGLVHGEERAVHP